MQENSYHGILVGLLSYKDNWSVFSNRESGDGYSDIFIEIDDGMETILKYGIACSRKHCKVLLGD